MKCQLKRERRKGSQESQLTHYKREKRRISINIATGLFETSDGTLSWQARNSDIKLRNYLRSIGAVASSLESGFLRSDNKKLEFF
ncbi:hypothetical protein LIER_19983 [Lithospermum erythrorhizon]|uniref:Uncharacterized protein n=1 Tax=Lithospermum erythrorhizon TaxID=34254 RepID=A0AAV3QJR0_LITER